MYFSEALRQALGLAHDQLPQHIYKMRLFGYPPGWLAEARMVQSGVTIFDKNGRGKYTASFHCWVQFCVLLSSDEDELSCS